MEIERELSYDIPISVSLFDRLKCDLDQVTRYMELSFNEQDEKYKIRIGDHGVLKKTVLANAKQYVHHSIYDDVPPIVYSLKISQEEHLSIADAKWQEAPIAIQVTRYYRMRNGWREAVTEQINKSSHAMYWYSLEKENVSQPSDQDFAELMYLVKRFWSTYKQPMLPRLPLRDASIGFRHKCQFPTEPVLYKHKIDGLNFIASYSTDGGWKSRCKDAARVDEQLSTLKCKNQHIVLFGEYTATDVFITELLYVRNYAAFRNLEEHYTLTTSNEPKLIPVDLYNSAKAMEELFQIETAELGPESLGPEGLVTRIKVNKTIFGIPPIELAPGTDGYLIVETAHVYSKLKKHHTIEVLMKDGFLFSRFCKLMIPMRVDPKVFTKPYQNKIIELRSERNVLTFVKIREDKVLPDTIEKIWQILAVNM